MKPHTRAEGGTLQKAVTPMYKLSFHAQTSLSPYQNHNFGYGKTLGRDFVSGKHPAGMGTRVP